MAVGVVVVHGDQLGRGRRVLEPGGLVGDGRGHLAQHVGEPETGQPQLLTCVNHELPRVAGGFAVAGGAARLDVPRLERPPPRAEPVRRAGQREHVLVTVHRGHEQALVAQLAEHLAGDQGAGLPPGRLHGLPHNPKVVNAVRSGSG
jgi:hypothetical protein